MGQCADCTYWERKERNWRDAEDQIRQDYARYAPDDVERRLAKVAELDHWGRCVRMDGPTWDERATGTLAVAEDGSSYSAHALTRENFGCVMFAKKESK